MALVNNMAVLNIMAVIKETRMNRDNQLSPKGAELADLAKGLFRQAGWRVVRRPKPQSGNLEPDIVMEAGGRKYVIECKSSAEGRQDRLIPLIAQAILEAQAAARQFPEPVVPVAVVAAARVPDSVARRVKEFALRYAPDVSVGVIDGEGLRDFSGHGLEALNAERSPIPKISRSHPPVLSLFSDLNQWMLKILLAPNIPEPLLSAPRGRYQNASQLAQAAGVSLMSAFRLIRQLSEESYLEERRGTLRLVRIEELMYRWRAANLGTVREIPLRWIFPGSKDQLSAAVRSFVSQVDAEPLRARRSSTGYLPRTGPRICVGLFAAAEMLGLGFVKGVAPQLYLERPDAGALRQLGLSAEDAERKPDVHVRIPKNGEAVFRAAVRRDGVPVSDILQVWLDVSNHPARGTEQAAQIWRRILAPLLQKAAQ